MGADDVLLADAAAAGQELPLHLGGQGQPTGAAGPEVEVGVAVGGGDLVSERRGEVGELQHGARVDGARGQMHGEDAETVAAHGDRQMGELACRVGKDFEHRFLGEEGTARGPLVGGDRGPVWGRCVTGCRTARP